MWLETVPWTDFARVAGRKQLRAGTDLEVGSLIPRNSLGIRCGVSGSRSGVQGAGLSVLGCWLYYERQLGGQQPFWPVTARIKSWQPGIALLRACALYTVNVCEDGEVLHTWMGICAANSCCKLVLDSVCFGAFRIFGHLRSRRRGCSRSVFVLQQRVVRERTPVLSCPQNLAGDLSTCCSCWSCNQ